jgi:hypothetical protein
MFQRPLRRIEVGDTQLQDLLEVQLHGTRATNGFIPSVLEMLLDLLVRVVLGDEDERECRRRKVTELVTRVLRKCVHELARGNAPSWGDRFAVAGGVEIELLREVDEV